MQKSELEEALVGIEPTGHYWFDFGQFMGEKNIKFVNGRSHDVHKTKDLDDNSPSKNDRKDPRVIAGLVKNGRYFYSYMPTGVYAKLRNASKPSVCACRRTDKGEEPSAEMDCSVFSKI